MADINQTSKEFEKLVKSVDISTFSELDQLTIYTAWMELIDKVRPIYLKNLAKNNESSTFLFKL
jgi:hypothetical protein